MIFQILIGLMFFLTSLIMVPQHPGSDDEEKTQIKEVIVNSYVRGIFVERDEKLVMAGFHPQFSMHVLDDNQIINAPLKMWLDRLGLDGQKNQDIIDYKFKFVDVTGNSAVAKMEIFENSKQLYTDYLSLYKFDSGWKIVSKIFSAHN